MDLDQNHLGRCSDRTTLCLGIIKAFTRGEVRHSEKFFRIFNEIPVLILVSVIFLAVLKPF